MLGDLRAFLWVLFLRQRRQPFWLLAEISLPLLFSSTILALYYQVDVIKRPDKVYTAFPVFGNGLDLLSPVDGVPLSFLTRHFHTLYYAPSNPTNDELMKKVKSRFDWTKVKIRPLLDALNLTVEDSHASRSVKEFCFRARVSQKGRIPVLKQLCDEIVEYFRFRIQGFKDEAEMVDYAMSSKTPNHFIGCIAIDEMSEYRLSYRLRWRYYHIHLLQNYYSGNLLQSWGRLAVPDGLHPIHRHAPNLSDGGVPAYWREELLPIQRAIDMAWSGGSWQEEQEVWLSRFPFPADSHHPLHRYAALLLPLVLMLSFLLNILYVSRNIGLDQEKGVKEYMEAVGLSSWTYLTAYLLLNLVKLLPPVLMLSFLFASLFPASHPLLIAFLIFQYGFTAVAFAFAVSSFIPKGTMSCLVGAVVWFSLYLPCLFLQKQEARMGEGGRVASLLLLNPAAIAFVRLLLIAESRGGGLHWGVFFETHGGLSPALVSLALAVDALLLLFLSGILQIRSCQGQAGGGSKPRGYQPKLAFISPDQSRKGVDDTSVWKIRVKNVSVLLKSGGKTTVAVKDVSFEVNDKSVTVMLGRNGSGKTTILNVLAGLRRPAEGSIEIGPSHGPLDRAEVVQNVGYCPQSNPLFSTLTVKEHLEFYSKLKGRKLDARTEAEVLMKLKLWEKRFSEVQTLSGGMKRKVSLAIALMGESRVVLLDEPTSGLDPEARKDVQSMLLAEKRRRLILLTTHYLDEADLLGDQVVLLHRGKLLDRGSNRILKRNFGEYASLVVSFDERGLDACIKEVKTVIKGHNPHAAFSLANGRHLTARLDTDRTTWNRLSKILHELDVARLILRISRLKVSITSLDDVYKAQVKNSEAREGREEADEGGLPDGLSFKPRIRIAGWPLFFLHLRVMMEKRFLLTLRQPVFLALQLSIPILAVALGVVVNTLNHRYAPSPEPIPLSALRLYRHSSAWLHNTLNGTDEGLEKFWTEQLTDEGIEVRKADGQLRNFLLHQATVEGAPVFLSKHFFGLNIHDSKIDAFFNPAAPHAIATSVNLASNALLKSRNGSRYNIETTNDPLPPQFVVHFLYGDEFVLALCMSVGSLLFLSTLSVHPTVERSCGSKHLQRLAGVSSFSYWLGHFAVDFFLCQLVNGGVVFVLWAGGVSFLGEGMGVLHALLLLLYHSWALLPFAYLSSFVFSSAPGGTAVMSIVNLVLSLCPTVGTAFLRAMSFSPSYAHLRLRPLELALSRRLSLFLPHFALPHALSTYYTNRLMKEQCDRLRVPCASLGEGYTITDEYLRWERPGIGGLLMALNVHGYVLFCVLFLIEWLCFSSHCRRPKKENPAFEQRRGRGDSSLETVGLTVCHRKERRPAVESLSLSVPAAHSLCLLGHNGAGKTTLFRALTGQIRLRYGSVFLKEFNLSKQFSQAGKQLGYCPQFDSLSERLTVVENLRLFAEIRGVGSRERRKVVDSLLVSLGLTDHAWQLVKNLSGGNKRKTSVGVAVAGLPSVLLLDEPTTGVDPKGRHDVAVLLSHLVSQHKSAVLLSSHSLDVIEGCSKEVVVMVEGRMLCQGQLRDFAGGSGSFYLRVLPANQKGADLTDSLVKQHFPSASAMSSPHPLERRYQIKRIAQATWPKLCRMLEVLQDKEKLNDFEICETFLEEFLGVQ